MSEIKKKLPLVNQKILVTAGPTYEAIDPVRFIGNHSSGKMGFAIADQFAAMGAEVILVCRANSSNESSTSIKRIDVTSAAEMLDACLRDYQKFESLHHVCGSG